MKTHCMRGHELAEANLRIRRDRGGHRECRQCSRERVNERRIYLLTHPSDEGAIARFWTHVDRRGANECWPWLAGVGRGGYGRTMAGGEQQAHRTAYRILVGAIADGLTLDHLCRNRVCVNPAHLEPVTRGENVLRGIGITAMQARQTRCLRGHAFTPENTTRDRRGHRACRLCRRERQRLYQPAYRLRKRLAAAA